MADDKTVSSTLSVPAGSPALAPSPDLELGATVGRHVIIGRLGAGGMGTVYAAYDPELDRKVAIKVLRAAEGGTHLKARLLREAQAMARLNHPNVIVVHDVGTSGGRVFFAMELASGGTLRDWLARPRPWRQVLATLLSAGAGLAAAHRAGLVHRDFKPDNVLCDDDGRVRVTDFGLVRAAVDETSGDNLLSTELTQSGSVVGTPGYMAPEQHEGQAIDARADQFSFCVTVYQALYGGKPFVVEGPDREAYLDALARPVRRPPAESRVPARIFRALERGLSRDPANRFPTLDALLEALAHDPWVWRRRVLAAGAVVAAIAGVAIAWPAPAERACRGLEAGLAGAWDAPAKAAVERAFLASGHPDAVAVLARVTAALDGYAGAWVAMRTDACRATAVRGEQSPALLDLRMRCLDRRLGQVRALARVFAGADRAMVTRAVGAVDALESLDGCADAEALTAAMPPPSSPSLRAWVDAAHGRLDRVDALREAGKRRESLALAHAMVIEARAAHHPPLLARALLALAIARAGFDDPGVLSVLEEAAAVAGEAHDDARTVRALTLLVQKLGRYGKPAEALALRPAVAALIARSGNLEQQAWLHQSTGYVLSEEGDQAGAEPELRLALALAERAGATGPVLTSTFTMLGTALYRAKKCPEARAVLVRGLAGHEARLGSDNPIAMSFHLALAGAADCMNDGAGLKHLDRAIAIAEKSYGEQSAPVLGMTANRALFLTNQGRYDEALEQSRRALARAEKGVGPEHTVVGLLHQGMGKAHAAKGELAPARAAYERARAIALKTVGPDHPYHADAMTGLAEVLLRSGEAQEALGLFQNCLAIRKKELAPDDPEVLAAQAAVAEALLALGRAAEAAPLLEGASSLEGSAKVRLPDVRARLAWDLARALDALGQSRGRALALAVEAHTLYLQIHRPLDDVLAIDSWLAKRARPSRYGAR